ncbi:MAG: hypothetical protein KC495_03155 [Dehalococcoidia bacterium]|nr:hypothetical protein [Dehalococcoidia bacterium]MCA9847951.1 hypothetical protein [Dehalococcoidia bacterium]
MLTTFGTALGLVLGYLPVVIIVGRELLNRASTASLATSAAMGTAGGFVATGLALYLGRRTAINRQINGKRERFREPSPLWRPARLDIAGVFALAVGTIAAIGTNAFEGAPGSAHLGRAVELNLSLLVLPVAACVAGSLLMGRLSARHRIVASRRRRSRRAIQPAV